MDWQCNQCAIWVSLRKENCTSCGKHWSTVWKKPSRRSQSRRRKAAGQKEDADPKEMETEDELTMFTGKTPWVASTPNSRLSTPAVTSAAGVQPEAKLEEAKMPVMPPEPVLPKPPSQNSVKVIEHLKGLKEVMGQLPEELETRLQQLEAAKPADKALSHAHLNRLVKLQRQCRAQKEKVMKLDEDWKKFVSQVQERFTKHKLLFVETRKQLIQSIRDKQQELDAAKEEISKASLSLLQQTVEGEVLEEDPELDDGQLMESLMDAHGQLADLDEYPEVDMDIIEDDPPHPTGAAPTVKPFSRRVSAGSPAKVAKEHLKVKEVKKNGEKESG